MRTLFPCWIFFVSTRSRNDRNRHHGRNWRNYSRKFSSFDKASNSRRWWFKKIYRLQPSTADKQPISDQLNLVMGHKPIWAYLRKTIKWPNNGPIKHLSLSITAHNHPERRIWSRNNAWIYNLISNNPKVPTWVSSNILCKEIKRICYSVWKPKFQSYEKIQHFDC